MKARPYVLIGCIGGVDLLIIMFVMFHWGGTLWMFSQLTGALLGGLLVLFSANAPLRDQEEMVSWIANERLSWILIGCALLAWGLGESIWRYYILTHRSPFPSLADVGYSCFPPLIFAGLLLQPSSSGTTHKRLLITLDCLIAMGSLLSVGWYLLLGPLAQASSENFLAKFLGLYYPITDIGLLSCIVFLLTRGQDQLYLATPRRVALLALGCGLCLFALSDFMFNILQNAGTYVEGTWADLGWPLGMLTIGLAAYFRRFLPQDSHEVIQRRFRRQTWTSVGSAQFVTYLTLGLLFLVLVLNVLSSDKAQGAIRPVLLFATILVVAIVVARQIVTIIDNQWLTRWQAQALEELARANQYIEDQARVISEHNADLESGILHLKEIQAQLANGNLRARATLSSGELFPLAASLNLMAERLARLGQADLYADHLLRALNELIIAVERYRRGLPFVLPDSCMKFPQIKRLVHALYIQGVVETSPSVPFSQSTSGPLVSSPARPSQPDFINPQYPGRPREGEPYGRET